MSNKRTRVDDEDGPAVEDRPVRQRLPTSRWFDFETKSGPADSKRERLPIPDSVLVEEAALYDGEDGAVARLGENVREFILDSDELFPVSEDMTDADIEQDAIMQMVSLKDYSDRKIGGWKAMLHATYKFYKEIEDRYANDTRIVTWDEKIANVMEENRPSDGSIRDAAIMRSVNRMGFRLSETQMRFMQQGRLACITQIYGTRDFERCQADIMLRAGVTHPERWLLVKTPRRCGKTTMLAMFIAALISWIPGLKIAVFSTVLRTAGKLMSEIIRFLRYTDPDIDERILRKKQDTEVHIAPRGYRGSKKNHTLPPEQVSIIYSYPANESSVRGFTVNVILIDEMAHINKTVWEKAIAPAMKTENIVFIGITTCDGPLNFFSLLLKKRRKTDGKPLFNCISVELACEKCQREGVTEACVHNKHLLPDWNPPEAHENVMCLLEDNKEAAMQELIGVDFDSRNMAFEPATVSAFEMLRHVQIHRPVDRLYMFVDPSGGGPMSSQSVVTMAVNGEVGTVSTHMNVPVRYIRLISPTIAANVSERGNTIPMSDT
jgi:hypothetical protein